MSGKAGKKKSKGTTLSLNAFLGNEAPKAAPIDWAEESQGFDDSTYSTQYVKPVNISNLPTAPRSSRMAEVDTSTLPDRPPFTAFVGNLPYECSEETIERFFKDLEIVSVRLIEEEGRFKGFGYVEFPDRATLIQALQLHDTMMGKRNVRVDVAESKNNQDKQGGFGRRGGGGGSFGSGGFGSSDGPPESDGEWRRKPRDTFSSGFDDRSGGRDGFGGDRGYDNRDSGRGGGYGQDRYGSRDSGYDRGGYGGDRGFGGDRSGGFGGDRGYGGDRGGYGNDRRDNRRDRDDNGFWSGQSNTGGGYDDRGGYGSRDRGYEDRGGYRDGGFGRDRDSGYGRDRGYGRDGGFGRDGGGGYGRDRGYDRDGDNRYGGDRNRGYGDRDGYDRQSSDRGYGGAHGYNYRSQQYRSRGDYQQGYRHEQAPAESSSRPKLNLKPRTKPIETDKSESTTSSSVFGGAKPVDTSAREREMEEKIQKEQEKLKEQLGSDDRGYGGRDRKKSYDDEPRSPRRSYEDSYRQDGSDKPRRTSQGDRSPRRQSRKTSRSDDHQTETSTKDDEPTKPNFVPAPVPKQSVWGQKKSHTEAKTPSEARGEREEAEGDDRDGYSDRSPEGAVDSGSSRRPNVDGRETNNQTSRSRPDPRSKYSDRKYDDRRSGQTDRRPPGSGYDNRRRGDGGPGGRRGYDEPRHNKSNEGHETRKRDSSRDSWPECDRIEDEAEKEKSKSRPTRPMKEVEPEKPVEFVQQSKFAALSLEGDSDE